MDRREETQALYDDLATVIPANLDTRVCNEYWRRIHVISGYLGGSEVQFSPDVIPRQWKPISEYPESERLWRFEAYIFKVIFSGTRSRVVIETENDLDYLWRYLVPESEPQKRPKTIIIKKPI